MPFVSEEWDTPSAAMQWTVQIDAPLTWRQAKEKIYVDFLAMSADVELAVQKKKVAGLEEANDFHECVERCKQPLEQHADRIKTWASKTYHKTAVNFPICMLKSQPQRSVKMFFQNIGST